VLLLGKRLQPERMALIDNALKVEGILNDFHVSKPLNEIVIHSGISHR
jgi:hypothetical protein